MTFLNCLNDRTSEVKPGKYINSCLGGPVGILESLPMAAVDELKYLIDGMDVTRLGVNVVSLLAIALAESIGMKDGNICT